VRTIIAIFAATSEQILMAANKPNGLQLAIARGRSIVGGPPSRPRRRAIDVLFVLLGARTPAPHPRAGHRPVTAPPRAAAQGWA
jgi:hypothetical protein